MGLIMDLIGQELSKLCALELENLPYLTLVSAYIDQSVPNLATIFMPLRSRVSSIMEHIEPELGELFALEFGKIAETDFVSSPEHELLRVSYCDHSPSVGIRQPSVRRPFTFPCLHSSIYKY